MKRVTHQLPAGTFDEFHMIKKNGSTRRICAPSPELLAHQRTSLLILVMDFNDKTALNGLTDVFHGFVPNRNCVTAAQQHVGFDVTIMFDIVNFFDSVPLSAVSTNANLAHPDGTLGQGFATSPILANTYLIPAARAIKTYLSTKLGDNMFAFTIYADDIQISISNEIEEYPYFVEGLYSVLAEIQEAVTTIIEIYNLELNPHKTRIRWAHHGYRRMLGVSVGNDHIKTSRKLLRKIRAARHQNNGPSLGGLTTASRLLLPRALRED